MRKKIAYSIITALTSSLFAISIMNLISRGDLDVFQDLLRVDVGIYAVPFFIFTSSYLVEAFRLSLILKMLGYDLRFSDSVLNNIFGYLFSYLTPFAMGGQPFQIYHLRLLGIPTECSTGIMAVRILENSVGSAIIALIVLRTELGWILNRGRFVFLGIVISFTVSTLLVLSMLAPEMLSPIVGVFSKVFRKNYVDGFRSWTIGFKESIRKMWIENFEIMLFDVVAWFSALSIQLFALYHVLYKLTGKAVGFWRVFKIVNAVNALAYFIPTPGSSGGIETTYGLVLSQLTGDPYSTVLAITVWRISTYYAQIALGMVLLFTFGKRFIS